MIGPNRRTTKSLHQAAPKINQDGGGRMEGWKDGAAQLRVVGVVA